MTLKEAFREAMTSPEGYQAQVDKNRHFKKEFGLTPNHVKVLRCRMNKGLFPKEETMRDIIKSFGYKLKVREAWTK